MINNTPSPISQPPDPPIPRSPDPLTLEDLLFNILRQNPDIDEINKKIIDFKKEDWHILFGLSMKYDLFPVFYDRIVKLNNIPSGILSEYKPKFLANLHRNLIFQKELFNIINHLSKYNIPVIPLKGTALGYVLYNDIALRQAGCDLDILIPFEKIDEAEKRLEETGYEIPYDSHFNEPERKLMDKGYRLTLNKNNINILHKYRSEISLIKSTDSCRLAVDLHWSFRDKFINMDIQDFWANTKEITLEGHKILFPTNEELFFYLIIASITKIDFICVKYLHEISVLSGKVINWEIVIDKIKKNKLNHIFFVAMSLARDLFNTDVPDSILEATKPVNWKINFLKKWINKNNILYSRGEIGSSYYWRFITVNFIYTMNFYDLINFIYRRAFYPLYETVELIFKQK